MHEIQIIITMHTNSVGIIGLFQIINNWLDIVRFPIIDLIWMNHEL